MTTMRKVSISIYLVVIIISAACSALFTDAFVLQEQLLHHPSAGRICTTSYPYNGKSINGNVPRGHELDYPADYYATASLTPTLKRNKTSRFLRNQHISPVLWAATEKSTVEGEVEDDNNPYKGNKRKKKEENLFSHQDITWKIRPFMFHEKPLKEKLMWKASCALVRLNCIVTGVDAPVILCPKGGKAQLEAYYDNKRIGRFGFTTEGGPPALPIQETVQELYSIETVVASAAIIYMFIEPQYRSRQLGILALQAISFIHAYQGCDFTLLVADDNGSGKLVKWYEDYGGFKRAPKLQDFLGSPNAQYGVAMIAPTNIQSLPNDCSLQW